MAIEDEEEMTGHTAHGGAGSNTARRAAPFTKVTKSWSAPMPGFTDGTHGQHTVRNTVLWALLWW